MVGTHVLYHKWVKKVSCGGVFDLAVEQPQLFRKLPKNKKQKHFALIVALLEKNTVPFSMAIGNEELMHACFPKHSLIRTERMK